MPDLDERIAIVGGGIIALEIARQLSKNYKNITLIRPNFDENIGSSAALGVSSVKGANWPRDPLFEFKINATSGYSNWLLQLEKESGQKIEKIFGAAEIISNQPEFSFKVERAFHHEFLGLNRINYRGDTNQSVLEYPTDMAANPSQILLCLKKIAEKNTFIVNSKVESIDFNEDQSWSVLLENKTQMRFDKIVLAAGVGLSALASEKAKNSWGLRPVYGHSMTWKIKNGRPMFVLDGTMAMILLKKTGFFGSTSFNDKNIEQDLIKKTLEEKLVQLCQKTGFDYQSDFSDVQFRFGIRLRTKDRLPLIGAIDPERYGNSLLVCGAFFKNGFHLANEAAKIILELVANQQPSSLSQQFSPVRFKLV